MKRGLDVLLSGLFLTLLIPIFAVIIVLLRFSAEGEVFYKQKRIGQFGATFFIWKFATMLKNSPNIGTGTITLRHDPRVTTVGRYLRKSKLNELPQLFNVLLGEMSLVGPRPLDKLGYEAIPGNLREQIYQLKPGITGVGSIVFRDEERMISESGMEPRMFYNQYIAPYKSALELWYYKHHSIFIDLILLAVTLWVVWCPNSDLIFRIFPSIPKK